VDRLLRQGVNGLCLLGIVLLGGALSVALYQVWELSTRWVLVTIVGIVAVSVSMYLVRIFSKFLLIVLLFSLPFAVLGTSFLGEKTPIRFYAGFFSVGLLDFLLIGLYMSWFYRVFVTREQPPPGVDWLDFFVLWFIVAHLVATFGGEYQMINGFGATEYLAKFVLFYLYLSRHLDERYLLWLLAAFWWALPSTRVTATRTYSRPKLRYLGPRAMLALPAFPRARIRTATSWRSSCHSRWCCSSPRGYGPQ
jgi:hypothetical protein